MLASRRVNEEKGEFEIDGPEEEDSEDVERKREVRLSVSPPPHVFDKTHPRA